MEIFKITTEYIQLNQLLKAIGWVEHGAEANEAIDAGLVKVNGVKEFRRRNKLMVGMQVEYKGRIVKID